MIIKVAVMVVVLLMIVFARVIRCWMLAIVWVFRILFFIFRVVL